jgi:two-component system cell cycle sensor histidine kinase/response regulator CckA
MSSVLVVDDLELNRDLVQTVLHYRGYTTFEASGGAEALALLRTVRPDLVVTDVVMPEVDGYQLARGMRADPDTAKIPVVFYSAAYLRGVNKPPTDIAEVHRILAKDGDLSELLDAIEDALA